MKKSFILMSLVLGALALTSCSKTDENISIAQKGNFTFKVAADTRAGIENSNVVWQDGDKIDFGAVETGSTETETAANVFSFAGDNSFSGTANLSSSKTYDFYAFFPSYSGKFFLSSRESNPNAYSKYVDFGAKGLTQNGETTDHVMQYAPMFGYVTSKSPENLTIPLHHLAALLDFTIVNNSENAIVVKSLQMTTPESVKFCGTYYASFDGSIKPSGDTYVYNTCTVSVSNGTSVAKGGSFHVYMPVAPFALASGAQVSFKITADSGVCEVSKTLSKNVTFTAGTISTQSLEFTAAAPVTFTTISSIKDGGNYTVENVKVLAVSGSNAIVGDATGNAIIYSKNMTIAAGNTVTLSGDVKTFNGVLEFDSPSITVTDASTTIDRGTPASFGDSEISAYAGNPTIAFVKASGKMDDNRSINFTNGYFWLYNENNSAGKYGDFHNKDVEVTGYTFGYQDKSGKTSVSFMITEIKEKGGVTPPTPPTPVGDCYTWDLTQASYASASADKVVWTSDFATVENAKGGATAGANNYLPAEKSSSRYYKNNILTITPGNGYSIKTIEFDAMTQNYANDFKNNTWANATASLRDSTVILTPADGGTEISATLGATFGCKSITVYYESGNTPAKVLTDIAVSGQKTSYSVGDFFSFNGTCTATYEGGSTKTVTPTSVSSPDMTSAGSKTVTVTYTEGSVTKTTTYSITVTAAVQGQVVELSEAEIKANISNAKRAYGTPVSYVDGPVTWSADCNVDAAGRPWFQLKKDANLGYLKIEATSAIKKVELTITTANNSSGGIADITKHTAFTGTIHLKTEPAGGDNTKNDITSTTSIENNVATINVEGNNTVIYVKTSAAVRIWGAKVTL